VNREGVAGLGRRREQALQEIAIRRARALSEYVPLSDLDPAVVARLKADSLVISPDGQPSLIATAHDLLEDWAILEWFEEQHLADADSCCGTQRGSIWRITESIRAPSGRISAIGTSSTQLDTRGSRQIGSVPFGVTESRTGPPGSPFPSDTFRRGVAGRVMHRRRPKTVGRRLTTFLRHTPDNVHDLQSASVRWPAGR